MFVAYSLIFFDCSLIFFDFVVTSLDHPEESSENILRRSENTFHLLQWWSMGKQILKHKKIKLIDTHCKRLNVFSDLLKITRIF